MKKIRDYIELNKKIWEKVDSAFDSKGKIYIPEETDADAIYSNVVRYIAAKAISEATGCGVVRLVNGYDNCTSTKVASSFGIITQNVRNQGVYTFLFQFIAALKAIFCICYYRTGEQLLEYRLDGISIGKDIYDKIIREQGEILIV